MRIDKTKKVRQVANENIVIMQAAGVADMTRVVAFNESALELHDKLLDIDFTEDDVVRVLLENYDVDPTTARHDAAEWVAQMRKEGLIVD